MYILHTASVFRHDILSKYSVCDIKEMNYFR